MFNLFIVAFGGFFGSIARYSLALLCRKHPIGTWTANIAGSILLAIIFRFYIEQGLPEHLWLLFGTGFCGAFTTFSTFGNEVLEMLLQEKYTRAIIYVSTSIGTSLCAVVMILLI